jgi:hypothetical protein
VRVAYADPPYIGCSALYRDQPDFRGEVDHIALIEALVDTYPDGWALSCHSNALRVLLPVCPGDTRVMAWVKPFCSFKPSVNPAYAWEPVLVRAAAPKSYVNGGTTVRDFLSAPMAMQRGLAGAKPEAFCYWLFTVLGLGPTDEFVDLFPGTGAVGAAWERYRRSLFFENAAAEPRRGALALLLSGVVP